jgi:hypothetical protein
MPNDKEERQGSESEAIVFCVRADPKPRDGFAVPDAKRTMMIADSNDANAVSPFLESQ